VVVAQQSTPPATPTGLAAPATAPEPADSNAQRTTSHQGNDGLFSRGVREPGHEPGFTTLPRNEGGTLIQALVQYPGAQFTNAGEAWRQIRNRWILPYGGWLMLGVILVIALFHWRVGPLGHHVMGEVRTIERFTLFERTVHWTNAIAFVVLGLSGVVIAFGKFFLLPIVGASLFGWITYALKTLHNFVGPLFAVTMLMVVLTFLRDELPKAHDWTWLKKGGGYLQGHEVPSHRFNAGEKILFWGGMLFLGAFVVASGLVLDKVVPGIEYTRAVMQIANIVHAISTILMMVTLLGHIYLGTIGMRGAYTGMRTGYVDEAWAKEHHELWYDDIKAGHIPAERRARRDPASAATHAKAT
jgi:formate dehydrogenase subunit gamma